MGPELAHQVENACRDLEIKEEVTRSAGDRPEQETPREKSRNNP